MILDHPSVSQVSIHQVRAEDVSVCVSIHDNFAAITLKIGHIDINCFTELDQVAGIKRNLGK